jgi:hypothetical protein
MRVLIKFSVIILSIFLAGAIWVGLVRILSDSEVPSLEHLSAWISHFMVFGWLLFPALCIGIYIALSSFINHAINAAAR